MSQLTVPTPAPTAESIAVEEMLDAARAMERATVRVVDAARRAMRTGAFEAVEGMPIDLALANLARMTGGDRRTILTTADVIGDLPWLEAAWRAGEVSWSQTRAICLTLGRRSQQHREVIDDRLRATADEHRGLDGFAPDDLVAEVDIALTELDATRNVQRREQRRAEGGKVIFAPRFDGSGGVVIADEPDPVRYAALTNAIDDAAGPPRPDKARSRQRADGLQTLAEVWMGGGHQQRRAKPLLLIRVDLADVATNTAGRVLLNTPSRNLPTITARTLDALGTDADLRIVLFDGGTPLAVSDVIHATEPTTKTRLAILARDTGDRFPGSTDPARDCDLHHDPPRTEGSDHHPLRLMLLSRRRHTMRHRHGWQLRIRPDGTVHAQRGNRRLRSLPRGTPLSRPRSDPDPDLPF